MVTDPIADYLTRIRNAVMANHRMVEIPKSKIKEEMTKILFEKGYILNYKVEDEPRPGIIKIALKYHPVTKISAINHLTRISKPGFKEICRRREPSPGAERTGDCHHFDFPGNYDR